MNVDLTLPDEGSFHNKTGQLIEWKLDPNDKTKCTILVDGKPLDTLTYLREEGLRLSKVEAAVKGSAILKPVKEEDDD